MLELFSGVGTPQALRAGGVGRGHLVASSGVQRGVHGLVPPRDGDTWIWCLACCSGFLPSCRWVPLLSPPVIGTECWGCSLG